MLLIVKKLLELIIFINVFFSLLGQPLEGERGEEKEELKEEVVV